MRRSCRIARLSRAAYYRPPEAWTERDELVIAALNAIVGRPPRHGFWKCFKRIRRRGHPWNWNVIDEGNREALAIEVGTSIPSARVIRLLEDLVDLHGRPSMVRVDNGPELTAADFADWCGERAIEIGYIQPGKPDQNAYIERFNRSYRGDVLDAYVFGSIAEVRAVTEEWLEDYNRERPHDSLGGVPPLTFLPRHEPAGSTHSAGPLDG